MSSSLINKCVIVLFASLVVLPSTTQAQRETSQDKPADNLSQATAKKGGKIKVAVIPQDRERKWTKDIMMSSMEDAIVGSGRFAVLSRSELDAVLGEQKLASTDLVDPTAAVNIGKALSAQYVLIIRTVSLENKAGGLSIGGYGKKTNTMNCNVQMQLIDTETTQIVESKTYSDKVSTSSTQVGDLGASANDAPGQDAYRTMVATFTTDFVNRLSNSIPIEASVVLVKGNLVALDGGAEKAMKAGVQFEITQEGEPIRDSAGKVLSYDTTKIGIVRVTRVEPKLAWCEVVQTFDAAGTPDATPNATRILRDFTAKQMAQPIATPTPASGHKS